MEVIAVIIVVFGLVAWTSRTERKMEDSITGRKRYKPTDKILKRQDESFLAAKYDPPFPEEFVSQLRMDLEASRASRLEEALRSYELLGYWK
jgi:hypothetical protein